MGFENVLEGHGIGIAITGMTVVFAGLVLVSLFLTALPKILDRIDAAGKPRAATAAAAPAPAPTGRRTVRGMDADLLAAITFVLQAERDRQLALDHQQITLREDDEQQVWTAIGRMRTLATRL
jgi:Na+-transporting methylmalonyl-CoA/oxaloacetate decarboxylase gamma subunit